MRRFNIFLALGVIVLLVIAGCARQPSYEGAETGTNKLATGDNEVNQKAHTEEESSSELVEGEQGDSASLSIKEETGGEDDKGDLVIKSENQVLAGSNQTMVNELDKELDNLIDTLNQLDTISEKDLRVE